MCTSLILSLTLHVVDESTLSFDEWNDSAGKLLSAHVLSTDDLDTNDDQLNEGSSTLFELVEFVRRQRL